MTTSISTSVISCGGAKLNRQPCRTSISTPEGASAYQQDGVLTLEGFGAELFDVTDIPGAQGFSQVASGEGATDVYGVAVNHEGLFVLALVTAPGSGASADDARTLATAQAAQAGVTLIGPGG